MSSVDKDTIFLDDKKQVVVTTPLLENKVLTTDKVTTSDEVHKHNENIKISEEIEKDTYEFHNFTEKITSIKEVDKGSEKLQGMKEGSGHNLQEGL